MPTLNWIGKEAVINHHLDVPFHLLKDVPELGCGDPGSGNLIVEGDNLLALKALLPYYKGKVKCICIDPPYNTGNEGWAYNDNVNSQAIKKWLGETVGKEGETLDRHDRWLCMMYPRLALLREFLREDGIILISIDEFEAARLRLLCDEIFGSQNFVAQLVWEKGRKNDAKHFSVGHEYLLVVARSKAAIKDVLWRAPKEGIVEIIEAYNDLRSRCGTDYEAISAGLAKFYKQLPSGHPSKKYSRAKNADHRGIWRDNNISWPGGGGPKYPILHPVTRQPCKTPDDGWRFVEESMKEKIREGWVVFRSDHKLPPLLKSYIYMNDEEVIGGEDEADNEGKLEVLGSVFYRHSQPANDVQKEIFGAKVFENPKDHEVIARLVRYVTRGDKQAVVLDSFGGSGTTAHAVLFLNRQDRGNRRFVLVELDEKIAKVITRERVKRVAEGYTNAKGEKVSGLGGGFRYVRLGDELFDENGRVNEPKVRFADLARHVYFSETGEPLPRERISSKTPLLGIHHGRAVYLLYNGILKDKSVDGGNVLTNETLAHLPPHDGPKVVYAAGCRFSKARLEREGITFKQTPYAIRTR